MLVNIILNIPKTKVTVPFQLVQLSSALPVSLTNWIMNGFNLKIEHGQKNVSNEFIELSNNHDTARSVRTKGTGVFLKISFAPN